MKLYERARNDTWPAHQGCMEYHPISVVVKDGHIIYAVLYEGRDEYSLTNPTDETYDTGETWST